MSQTPTQGNNLQYIQSVMNSVRQSPNPQIALQSLIQNNPGYQNVLNYINQNGGDPRTAFYNMAQQKGVDPSQILNILNIR